MDPDKVAADEARRHVQHERIKEELEEDVHSRIVADAPPPTPAERADIESVAASLKRKAAAEVVETETDLERARGLARVAQVIDYVFFLIYSVIGLEIALELFGARQSSGFKRFLDQVTAPFLAPFRGLMPDPALGPMQLMLSYIVALVVYLLLHQAVKKLLRLLAHRESKI
jgi:uncharacterized protein YggT (Ycf19 family)